MFNIGDKIVYPSQGVGIIELIGEMLFKGEVQNYYKIHIFNNNMTLTLPVNRVEDLNIRLVSDSETLDSVLENVKDFTTNIEELNKSDFKQRAAINNQKIKSGTLTDYLEVIYNLTKVKEQHSLNSSEKDTLRKTVKTLVEEISQSKNLSNDDASSLLNLAINF
ncbi:MULTISPECIES: CarD family transcriptional regulator [Clostridium]|uniref:CarD family transcriptional regulator n=1 Tax=Clostridium aquiflavi TaxID=3073603 RepID=A0ABU1EI39_9CLOT|nr:MULTISPECIES: CarD family transcriptional regulator [Clostridium]MBN1044392.1 CarD family transcriptional regulator [Clostridium botulinum]MDR5587634.1 CarD family transcriptional regulator [Clostridium sp. 5N-1]NFN92663.1 CarD family transcriptional regulator [Clostridium botulinum]NFS27889.1 CarD family transcriptional regulator [Clostridium botulinum]NFS55473.1 CarD family transcriptional regulator [Clostridium botulinum]